MINFFLVANPRRDIGAVPRDLDLFIGDGGLRVVCLAIRRQKDPNLSITSTMQNWSSNRPFLRRRTKQRNNQPPAGYPL